MRKPCLFLLPDCHTVIHDFLIVSSEAFLHLRKMFAYMVTTTGVCTYFNGTCYLTVISDLRNRYYTVWRRGGQESHKLPTIHPRDASFGS